MPKRREGKPVQKFIAKKYVDEEGFIHYICPHCGYEWIPRTPNPKSCPICKRKLVVIAWTQE